MNDKTKENLILNRAIYKTMEELGKMLDRDQYEAIGNLLAEEGVHPHATIGAGHRLLDRLIEDLKLVYGDNKPIATVITHNNHKLLSFDPGALDELPEGTILYAKKYGAK